MSLLIRRGGGGKQESNKDQLKSLQVLLLIKFLSSSLLDPSPCPERVAPTTLIIMWNNESPILSYLQNIHSAFPESLISASRMEKSVHIFKIEPLFLPEIFYYELLKIVCLSENDLQNLTL